MCKRSLAWCLQLSKTRQNVKTVLVQLVFPINAHQNVNQKPIGSMPAYQAQCTLPPQPIYLTLLFDFLRVWFRDYLLVAYALKYEYGTKGADSLLLGVPDSLLLGVPPLVCRFSPLRSSTPCLHITQAHSDYSTQTI